MKKRTIFETIIAVGFLSAISISSCFATVTINDNALSDDTFGTILSFDNDYIDLANATFTDNITVDGRTIDSADFSAWDTGGSGFDLTKIWNSNGNNWSASGGNIQLAINDLDNCSGKVLLPGNSTLTISSTIQIYKNICLDMQGCTIQPSSDIDMISMHKNSGIIYGNLNASNLASYTSNMILFDGGNHIGNSWYSGYGNFGHTYVEHLYLQGTNVVGQHPEWMNGTAIKMICDNNNGGEHIIGCYIEDVDIHSFEYGIHLYCPGGSPDESEENYINGNYFFDIDMMQCRYGIVTDRNETYSVTDSSIYGNEFTFIQQQVNKCTDEVLISEGDFNKFEILIWDWGLANNTAEAVNLTEYCNSTTLTVTGGSDYIFNNGHKNTVWNVARWDWGTGNAHGTLETPAEYNFTGIVNNKYGNGMWVYDVNPERAPYYSSMVRFFYYSSGNSCPLLAVYGGTQSTDYIALQTKNDYSQIISNDNLVLNPLFDKFVGINNTAPTSELDVIGDIHCTGKLTSDGGNDPPYVLYNKETLDSIIKRINQEIPHDEDHKWDGQAIFFNNDTKRMTIINPKTGNTQEFVMMSDYIELEQRVTELENLILELMG